MKGYIATNRENKKVFFRTEPKMVKDSTGKWEWSNLNDNHVVLSKRLFDFPDIVRSQCFNDNPIEVEISIMLL